MQQELGMQRSINVAIVQMDVRPSSTGERLFRADAILCDAVELGAELVVLPEMFNTGYAYTDENFQRAETAGAGGRDDGPTVTWMKRTAHRLGVHLAGTLLLREADDIYNAMLIVSPDGRTWRYDKCYPWGWERGYFRPTRQQGADRAVVAHTDLGDLGMMICWDIAHTELWQYYAGKVDMLVISSSPPQITSPTLLLGADLRLSADDLGPMWAGLKDQGSQVFGAMVAEQAGWLGVPVAHSAACGTFESPVPNGRNSLLGLVPGAPGLVRWLGNANEMRLVTAMIDASQIILPNGSSLAHISQAKGEGFAIVEVPLAEEKPAPQSPQPPSRASWMATFYSDTYLPKIMQSVYQNGVRRK